jgi:sugar phosphate isomerase/epimerase
MYFEEIKSYAPLCEIFRTPFIRVFGGKIGNTSWPEAIDTAAENFKNMAAIAEDHNVKILLETHDDWLDSDKLKLLMEKVDSNSTGILWDTHHPYRLIGEGISKTWQTIGKWIKYTHWKDSFIDPNTKRGHQICLVGDGDIPLKEIYSVLRDGNYTGYFTLEWEKKWNPEIEEPEVAFPKYVKVMRELS